MRFTSFCAHIFDFICFFSLGFLVVYLRVVGVHSEYIQIEFSFGYLLSVVKGICFFSPFLWEGELYFTSCAVSSLGVRFCLF